jgi:hypothetical protein
VNGPAQQLTLDTLIGIVGHAAFDDACREASGSANESTASNVPHELSDRLWYAGSESFTDRLTIAIELYRRMPCYANLMYWRYRDFEGETRAQMWAAYRELVGHPDAAVAEPIAYSLWVDYFEDASTMERAWSELSGPQEPRRPRLDRVLAASGPVAWPLKAPLYQALAEEGGWDDPIVAGLYGSCVDIYGSIEREAALGILRRLRQPTKDDVYRVLTRALEDPDLPVIAADRRTYVAQLERTDGG